jgi:hypothetical protein
LLKSLNFRYALIRKNNKAQMGALMLDKQWILRDGELLNKILFKTSDFPPKKHTIGQYDQPRPWKINIDFFKQYVK